jgi:integrase
MPRRGENVKQLPNGRWQARYRKLDGNEVTKTFDRKTDAARWRRDGLAARDRGEFIDPKLGRVTVREYGERWRAAQLHHRPSSSRIYETDLRLHIYPHIGDRPMNRVTRSDIESLVKLWVEGGAAPRTVRESRFKVLAAMFRAAVRDDVIRKTPCDRIRLPEIVATKHVVLTAEQVRALADAIDPRYRAMVLLGYGCGLRIGETRGLTEPNVRWLAGEILVCQQLDIRPPYPLVPLKNSRRCPSRVVPMPRYVHEALSRHIEVYGLGEHQLLFSGVQGGPAGRTVHKAMRAARREAGLPDSVSYHTLRHSYATQMIANGISETDVAELLGDAVALVHQVYGHASVDFKKRARQALETDWAAPAAVAESSRTHGLAQVRDLR